MLDSIDVKAEIDKQTYQKRMDELEKQMTQLQLKIKELGIPVIITFDGWSSAGKGTLISRALEPLDPRYFRVYTMEKVSEDQFMRPFLCRYAVNMPTEGLFSIFSSSWNMAAIPGQNLVRNHENMDMETIYSDILAFEKQLTDSGAVIVKVFLHINKDEQQRRFKELEKNEDTKWRVTNSDHDQNKDYNTFYEKFDKMLERTNEGPAKWTVIPSNDKRYAAITFFEVLSEKLKEAISKRADDKPEPSFKKDTIPDLLSAIDLNKDIQDDKYQRQLKQSQKELSGLGFKLYRKRRSVVIVYEGWDASGKGGNIKRLTEELDPRGYDVLPISAPTKEELSHHYLWRFWKNIPKDGHIAIFDRSWYGRVMVERLEGFCSETEWRRAYDEINEMELHLHHHGVMIFKFWLHIDKDEQLFRFNDRIANPLKQYKIGDEDWRNRAKWDDYLSSVNEMLYKTSTEYAPWTVVEANSKKFARIKVLEHVTKALSKEI